MNIPTKAIMREIYITSVLDFCSAEKLPIAKDSRIAMEGENVYRDPLILLEVEVLFPNVEFYGIFEKHFNPSVSLLTIVTLFSVFRKWSFPS